MPEQARRINFESQIIKEPTRELEKTPDFLAFQEVALGYLEQLGIAENRTEGLVVDLEKLKALTVGFIPLEGSRRHEKFFSLGRNIKDGFSVDKAQYKKAATELKPYIDYYNGKLSDFLFNAFYNRKVLSKEESMVKRKSTKERPKPRQLFYSPENVAAAFDIEKIKQTQFYLGPWEVEGNEAEGDYSLFHEGLPKNEVSLACIIYHPNYGNGQRSGSGNLVVNYQDGSKNQITQEWLEDCGLGYNKKIWHEGSFLRAPNAALKQGAMPNMQKNHLIEADDFQILATREQNKKFNLKRPLNQRNGAVILNDRIRYTLGDEYGNQKTKAGETRYFAHQISEKLGGITELQDDGSEKIVAVFDLFQPGDPKLKKVQFINKNKKITEYFAANRQDINLRPYDPTERIFNAAEEAGNEDVNFSAHLKAKQELVKVTGISLETLSSQEQKAFTDYYIVNDEKRKSELYGFVGTFKVNGLRTFLALQFDSSSADKIFVIAKNYTKSEAELIFAKYCGLINRAQQVDTELKHFFVAPKKASQDDKLNASSEIMRRAGVVLASYSQKQTTGTNDLLLKLKDVSEDIIAFGAIFKTAVKGKEKIEFTDIRGVDFFAKDSASLTAKEKSEMIRIFVENRSDYPDMLLRESLTDFEQALNKPGEKFYILNKDKNITSFIRFSRLGKERLYAGSLNVRPEARGLAIGSAFFQTVLEKEGASNDIEAVVYGKNPMLPHYLADFNFKIVREISNYHDTGEKFFNLKRSKIPK